MTNDNDETAPAILPLMPAQDEDVPKPSADTPAGEHTPLEVAHVLFIDVVGYSKLLFDQQREYLELLQQIVRGTTEFRQAQSNNRLISLPTGDGMALVFFNDPESPLRCAVEIARALKTQVAIKLRMGIHSGPIYRIADINASLNVAGGGINLAQRIMDCGDDGHILLSKRTADDLSQISKWAAHIHYLGEVQVKHGLWMQVSNFYTADVGKPEPPQRFAPVTSITTVSPSRGAALRWPKFIIALLLLAAALAGSVMWLNWRSSPPGDSTSNTNKVAPARLINYWIVVQKYRRGQPYEAPFRLAGEINFEPDYRIRIFFDSPQTGYLYLINEGPEPVDARPDFNLLFPTPTANGGSSLLAAEQQVQVPESSWLVFDQQRGSELLWVIWSAQRIEELEGLKTLVNPQVRGVISIPSQVNSVRTLLGRAAEARVGIAKDVANSRTELSGNGALLIHPIRLEHH